MNRRQFLAAGSASAGLGLSGCLSALTGASSRTLDVRVEEIFDNRHETGVTVDIEQVSSTLTSDALPELAVTLSNDGRATHEVDGWSSTVLEGASNPRGLFAMSGNRGEEYRSDPPEHVHPEGCLTLEHLDLPAVNRHETLEPDEERLDRVSLIGDHEAFDGNCLDPDAYTITRTHTIEEMTFDEEHDRWQPVGDGEHSFEWGITLEVREST